MEEKNRRDKQLEDEHQSKLRTRAIDQLAIGTIIFLWGALLTLKQVGIIDKNVSTWSFPLTTFGILLVVGGIYRLNRLRREGEISLSEAACDKE
jgi:hypothetical protein